MFKLSEDRIKHMHGVAELMYTHADSFDCRYLSKEELYLLGLLHDIGYILGKEAHESNGAQLLLKTFSIETSATFLECIEWHGHTPREYVDLKMCSFTDIPQELILLWWADMMVESSGEKAGQVVGFNERLNNIKERYGEHSKPYIICKETMDWLSMY